MLDKVSNIGINKYIILYMHTYIRTYISVHGTLNKAFPNYSKLKYVTVHAKTSLVRTKIEINFFTPGYSYIH